MKTNIKKILESTLILELNNGPLIYYLIQNNSNLRKIIDSSNNKKVISNLNANTIINPNIQIIYLLDRLINRFDDHFPLLHRYRTLIINNFFEYNECKNYLLEKHYIGDNNYINYYENKLNIIFIKSFYNNLKYIQYELIDVFKENKINTKKLSSNNPTEIKKLLNLLSDFSYCYHRWDSTYLFTEIDSEIKLNKER